MFTLQTYLLSAKSRATNANFIVLGNEAADLDSMASSIAYGFLRSLQDVASVVLPVMPIPRADFALRTEAVYVFTEAGIDITNLVFLDEIDLGSLLKNGAGLILVDHNRLSPKLVQYAESVIGVLDHHMDEGFYLDVSPRIIQAIGSTTSLVAMEFAKAGFVLNTDVATLLCGTILLDTVNLDPDAGRVTVADREVVMKILPLCLLGAQEFFDNVQRAKFDVAGLSTRDLFRKDYKEFKFDTAQCGICSVLLPVTTWAELEVDLFTGFAKYAADLKLDVLFSMNAFVDSGFCRDFVLFCKTKTEHDVLVEYLQKNDLQLIPMILPSQPQGETGYIRFYTQGNVGISRKKLQPLLADFYKA